MTEATMAALFLVPTLAVAGNFTTFIGDSNPLAISAIAADSAGNTYVAGTAIAWHNFEQSVSG